MSYWNITVHNEANPFAMRTIFVVDHPFLAAEWVSKGNPEQRVTLEAQARIRATYLNGKMVSESRNLRKFYTNISDALQWAWENGNELPENCRGRVLATYAAECPSCLAKAGPLAV